MGVVQGDIDNANVNAWLYSESPNGASTVGYGKYYILAVQPGYNAVFAADTKREIIEFLESNLRNN